MNRKIYINSIFEHLSASNFAESLFLKYSNAYKILRDLLHIYFSQIFSKISEKRCCFLNNIFHKFEIVVCFAPLSHGVKKNTILNFDSKTECVKSKNNVARRKRGECPDLTSEHYAHNAKSSTYVRMVVRAA